MMRQKCESCKITRDIGTKWRQIGPDETVCHACHRRAERHAAYDRLGIKVHSGGGCMVISMGDYRAAMELGSLPGGGGYVASCAEQARLRGVPEDAIRVMISTVYGDYPDWAIEELVKGGSVDTKHRYWRLESAA